MKTSLNGKYAWCKLYVVLLQWCTALTLMEIHWLWFSSQWMWHNFVYQYLYSAPATVLHSCDGATLITDLIILITSCPAGGAAAKYAPTPRKWARTMCTPNLKSVASSICEILRGSQNFEIGHVPPGYADTGPNLWSDGKNCLASMCVPNLNSVDLSATKKWCIFLLSTNWPGDLDLWPFDLEVVVGGACDLAYLCANFGLPRTFRFWVRPDVRDRLHRQHRTDTFGGGGPPPPFGGRGIIIILITCTKLVTLRHNYQGQ